MRSKLFVPASRPELFDKALAGPADAVSFDLQDAVEASRKGAAREALARELAAVGVPEVRGLGSLPYVALEVDARQLEALLATGRVPSMALNRAVGIN